MANLCLFLFFLFFIFVGFQLAKWRYTRKHNREREKGFFKSIKKWRNKYDKFTQKGLSSFSDDKDV